MTIPSTLSPDPMPSDRTRFCGPAAEIWQHLLKSDENQCVVFSKGSIHPTTRGALMALHSIAHRRKTKIVCRTQEDGSVKVWRRTK